MKSLFSLILTIGFCSFSFAQGLRSVPQKVNVPNVSFEINELTVADEVEAPVLTEAQQIQNDIDKIFDKVNELEALLYRREEYRAMAEKCLITEDQVIYF